MDKEKNAFLLKYLGRNGRIRAEAENFCLHLMCSHRRSQTIPSCRRPSQVVTVNQKQSQSQTVAGCHIPAETVKCCHRASQNVIGCPKSSHTPHTIIDCHRPSEPLGS